MTRHPIDVLATSVAIRVGRRGALRLLLGASLGAIGGSQARTRAVVAQAECDDATPTRCQVALALVCVDTATDPLHCGACGNACAADEPCVAGVCGAEQATPVAGSDETGALDADGATAADPATASDSDRTYESPQFGYRIRWKTPWEAGGAAQSLGGLGDTFRLRAGETISRVYVGEATERSAAETIARDLERDRTEVTDLVVVQEYDADAEDARLITRFEKDGTAYERVRQAVAITDPTGILMVETQYPARTSPDYVRAIEGAVVLDPDYVRAIEGAVVLDL